MKAYKYNPASRGIVEGITEESVLAVAAGADRPWIVAEQGVDFDSKDIGLQQIGKGKVMVTSRAHNRLPSSRNSVVVLIDGPGRVDGGQHVWPTRPGAQASLAVLDAANPVELDDGTIIRLQGGEPVIEAPKRPVREPARTPKATPTPLNMPSAATAKPAPAPEQTPAPEPACVASSVVLEPAADSTPAEKENTTRVDIPSGATEEERTLLERLATIAATRGGPWHDEYDHVSKLVAEDVVRREAEFSGSPEARLIGDIKGATEDGCVAEIARLDYRGRRLIRRRLDELPAGSDTSELEKLAGGEQLCGAERARLEQSHGWLTCRRLERLGCALRQARTTAAGLMAEPERHPFAANWQHHAPERVLTAAEIDGLVDLLENPPIADRPGDKVPPAYILGAAMAELDDIRQPHAFAAMKALGAAFWPEVADLA